MITKVVEFKQCTFYFSVLIIEQSTTILLKKRFIDTLLLQIIYSMVKQNFNLHLYFVTISSCRSFPAAIYILHFKDKLLKCSLEEKGATLGKDVFFHVDLKHVYTNPILYSSDLLLYWIWTVQSDTSWKPRLLRR